MIRIHDLIQGSPEWAAFRLTHHGASEAAAMLGLSKKMTRTELLRLKHTGMQKEFSDFVQEQVLDHGHIVEAMARPIAEELVGEDLYPVTCTNDDLDERISASCDGLTMGYDTVWEHKQWNEALAESVRAGILPEEHMPQCQQQLMVTAARRNIFTVSDGTRENFASMEVLPDPVWFERIKAGWAQFDKELADYTEPEHVQASVAEPVQSLPAVSIQVTGQIDVRENFKVFEVALRDFLDNKLIRDPQTDEDFADLDLQIKAMKKAEEALSAAESMMLAQIRSVDEAKRQKDMLAELVRSNRLMAEKLLASEKERRRTERVTAAREAFTSHVAALQQEIQGLRLDVPMPDFGAAIKGLKTLASIQDKIDTALANGKIAADQAAADLRAKLAWVNVSAAEYRSLLADLQQLSAKPIDDFKLAITVRIDAHKAAEAKRLEDERERIRQEEEQKAQTAVLTQVLREPAGASPLYEAHGTTAFDDRGNSAPTPQTQPPMQREDEPATLTLGTINDRLAPISLSCAGLAELGITHSATHKAAKLYRESDFDRICQALMRHVEHVHAAAATADLAF